MNGVNSKVKQILASHLGRGFHLEVLLMMSSGEDAHLDEAPKEHEGREGEHDQGQLPAEDEPDDDASSDRSEALDQRRQATSGSLINFISARRLHRLQTVQTALPAIDVIYYKCCRY